jgi:hypothetical protein
MTAEANRRETWFVSYKTRAGSHHERMTRTFKSENEAKQFALRMLDEEKHPIAGTLNPCRPKRTISPFQVANWVSSDSG